MIHILFSSSAAGTLRQTLSNRGKRERVVDLNSDLDWGPLAPQVFEEQEAWLNRNIPWEEEGGWDWIAAAAYKFQEKVEKDPDRLIWIAPRSASEQCGLYWYLDRFGGDGVSMILADFPLFDAWRSLPPGSLGELGTEQIGSLLDTASRQLWDGTRFPTNRWQALLNDNTLLRIVDQGTIKSVSEETFDQYLLSRCSRDWKKCYRVVGDVMAFASEYHRIDSVFLAWRLRVLAEKGDIETTGEITAFPRPGPETIFVRLA